MRRHARADAFTDALADSVADALADSVADSRADARTYARAHVRAHTDHVRARHALRRHGYHLRRVPRAVVFAAAGLCALGLRQ